MNIVAVTIEQDALEPKLHVDDDTPEGRARCLRFLMCFVERSWDSIFDEEIPDDDIKAIEAYFEKSEDEHAVFYVGETGGDMHDSDLKNLRKLVPA